MPAVLSCFNLRRSSGLMTPLNPVSNSVVRGSLSGFLAAVNLLQCGQMFFLLPVGMTSWLQYEHHFFSIIIFLRSLVCGMSVLGYVCPLMWFHACDNYCLNILSIDWIH